MSGLKLLPVTLNSRVVAGKLPDFNRDYFNQILEHSEGKTLSFEISYYVRKRSNAQNSFYWPVVVEYVLEGMIDLGYPRHKLDPQIVHDYLKDKFLRYMKRRIYNPVTKKYITKQASSAELKTWEFIDYVDGITIWAVDFLSIQIPDPDKKWRDKAEADYNEALKRGLIHPDERNRVRIALKLQR